MRKHVEYLIWSGELRADNVTLKWSEALESAFDLYYSEYITAWALTETPFNKVGDMVFIRKKSGEWVGWETIDTPDRPDIATLFELMPDLPTDREYWQIIRELKAKEIKNSEDYFWENIFSYKHADEIEINGKKYKINWEA